MIRTAKEQKPWKAPGSAPYLNFHKAKSLADRMGVTPTIQTVKNLEVTINLDEKRKALDAKATRSFAKSMRKAEKKR